MFWILSDFDRFLREMRAPQAGGGVVNGLPDVHLEDGEFGSFRYWTTSIKDWIKDTTSNSIVALPIVSFMCVVKVSDSLR